MSTYRELRQKLMKDKGLSKQTLSAQVKKKREHLPMSAEDATCIIAHENGMKIHRYLSNDKLAHMRGLQAQLRQVRSGGSGQATRPSVNGKASRAAASGLREIRFANQFKVTSSMLDLAKLDEAKEMAAVYPILYVLENSMREVVRRVMRNKFGDDWFDTQLTSGKLGSVKKTAVDRMKNEQRWHQRRGSHPVDYIDLKELSQIITGNQTVFFPGVLGDDVDWFRHFMKELEPSRNVVCHMNPLSKTNSTDLLTKIHRWEELVRNAGSNIPAK